VTVVNIHDAKTHLSKLLERMLAGEDIVIAKAGKPLARLIPVDAHLPRTPGLAKGRVTDAFFEPLPEAELKAWEA
jgi:prevent-host-death family protein